MAISHAIVATVHPRSFTSPLLVSLSMFINRRYRSHRLLDILQPITQCQKILRAEELAAIAHMPLEMYENHSVYGLSKIQVKNFSYKEISAVSTFNMIDFCGCLESQKTSLIYQDGTVTLSVLQKRIYTF